MERFKINPDGTASYQINEETTVSGLNLESAYGWSKLSELARSTLAFALKTVLRNETAGKMKDAATQKEAAEDVAARIKAINDGKWTVRVRGEAGEARTSILARALAQVLDITPDEAADMVSKEIVAKLEEAGIDPETENDDLTDEQKKAKRKIGNAVRKGISDDPAVKAAADAIRLAALQAAAAESAKAAATTASRFTK